ncbi:MAG: cyclic nucleotide-binding domain-containing protein [Candidatus Eremiobacteraeota bacterium]|nr:cyclic nucleotide-binding domain-containing protein [Candidatus Eremiobacteraeota bacterium]
MRSKIDILRNYRLFREVSDGQLRVIASVLREREAKKGETILEENTPGHEMYILVEGRVEVSHTLTLKTGKNTFADKDKSLNTLCSEYHCFFGEIALVDPTATRTATVTALTDCRFLVIERQDFERICESDFRLGYLLVRNIAEEICGRLKKTENDLLKITTAFSIALSR